MGKLRWVNGVEMLYTARIVYKIELEAEGETEDEAVERLRQKAFDNINEAFGDFVYVEEIETENPCKKDFNWRDFI